MKEIYQTIFTRSQESVTLQRSILALSLAILMVSPHSANAQGPSLEKLQQLIDSFEEGGVESEQDVEAVDDIIWKLIQEFEEANNSDEDVNDQIESEVEESLDGNVEESSLNDVINNLIEEFESSQDSSVDEEESEDSLDNILTGLIEQFEQDLNADEQAEGDSAVEEDFSSDLDEGISDAVADEESSDAPVDSDVVDDNFSTEDPGNFEEQQVVDTAEETAETEVAAELEENLIGEAESEIVDVVEGAVVSDADTATTIEGPDAALGFGSANNATSSAVDETVDSAENREGTDDVRIHLGQWLVMAEPRAFLELAKEGYVFDAVTDLPSLGLKIAEVSAPASFDISVARAGIYDVIGSESAQVDLNHFYTAGDPGAVDTSMGILPRDAMPLPLSYTGRVVNIGMIDSSIDLDHPAFVRSNIEIKSFTRSKGDAANFHGTAIASLFVANTPEMVGLVPNSKLYSAAVFDLDEERGEVASTLSLVRSLDWLLEAQVDVINLSLTGPPNKLLEVALDKVTRSGIIVLAAAGNDGPMALPKYPAAYGSVVAVTAVDSRGRAFRMANRGGYLALAAPGVNLRHATPGGGYSASSGTSYAVPFVSSVAAVLKHAEGDGDVISKLYSSALDLGEPGHDEIYGYGLLRLQ